MEYGLIGEHLSDSFSKFIHERIVSYLSASYIYEIYELGAEQAGDFLRSACFKGINVAAPYRQLVIPYLDEISGMARIIGSVDTIINKDGKLLGYNTSYLGMKDLLKYSRINSAGKKVLILGTGEESRIAHAAVKDLGAAEIYKVCPAGEEDALSLEEAYEECTDADIIINTTSCGMSPDLDSLPLKLEPFTKLAGLVDLIYDPLRTSLVLEAQKRDIPAQGGLYMQVMKEIHAWEIFTCSDIDREVSDRIYQEILNSRRNIVLTGMSLAGKTTLGTLVSEKLGRRLEDTDLMIIDREKREITSIFATDGEPYFRNLETAMCRELAAEKGIVIATGGGAILRLYRR
jgi:shikimate dehydrogenase